MKSIRLAGKRTAYGRRADHEDARRFIVLAVFAAIVFLLGGASRPDVLPILVIVPLAITVAGWGLLTMPTDLLRRYRMLWWFSLAAVVLVAAQLVPLPPGLWHALPGRELASDIDRAAGLGAIWRPISLTPDLTWNSLFALATPVATLLLALALPPEWSARLCWVLMAAGLASGFLGVLQIVGLFDGSLSYYQATGNAGAAVGLFANRNHEAAFLACLFPVLAAFAGGGKRRHQATAAAIAVVLVPLIVATGSRAGLLLGGFGLVSGVLLLLDDRHRRAPTKAAFRRWRTVPALAAGALILMTTVAWLTPSTTWGRLLSSGGDTEKRLAAWPVVVRLARDQMPLGSGFGSFDPVFRAGEPMALLSPTYFNHAHNDWLELWMTGGIPAVALLAAAAAAWVVATGRVWSRQAEPRSNGRLARAASVVLLMLALASIVDYPLRTPSLSMFAAIAVAWLAAGQRSVAEGADPNRGRAKSSRSFPGT